VAETQLSSVQGQWMIHDLCKYHPNAREHWRAQPCHACNFRETIKL